GEVVRPEIWDEDLGFAAFTQLRFNVLADKSIKYSDDDEEGEITAVIPVSDLLDNEERFKVSFKIFRVEDTKKTHVLVLRRLNGDMVYFMKFFEELEKDLCLT